MGETKDRVNLAEKLELLDKPFEPGIVGHLNDYKLQIVKVKGAFVWHNTMRRTTSSSSYAVA